MCEICYSIVLSQHTLMLAIAVIFKVVSPLLPLLPCSKDNGQNHPSKMQARSCHPLFTAFSASRFTTEEVTILETVFEALPKRSLKPLWPTPNFPSLSLLQLHSSSMIGIVLPRIFELVVPSAWNAFLLVHMAAFHIFLKYLPKCHLVAEALPDCPV